MVATNFEYKVNTFISNSFINIFFCINVVNMSSFFLISGMEDAHKVNRQGLLTNLLEFGVHARSTYRLS